MDLKRQRKMWKTCSKTKPEEAVSTKARKLSHFAHICGNYTEDRTGDGLVPLSTYMDNWLAIQNYQMLNSNLPQQKMFFSVEVYKLWTMKVRRKVKQFGFQG